MKACEFLCNWLLKCTARLDTAQPVAQTLTTIEMHPAHQFSRWSQVPEAPPLPFIQLIAYSAGLLKRTIEHQRAALALANMSLQHALLTALADQPCAGSELANRFDRSIGYFWHATHQQIYRELARLEAAGWVQQLPAESGRGRKRAYKLLAAGRKELRRWVTLRVDEPEPLRQELMVRLRAEAVVGPTNLHLEIGRLLALHQDQLANYRRMEQRDFAQAPASREARLKHLVLRAGLMYESLWVDFCREVLDVLHPAEPHE